MQRWLARSIYYPTLSYNVLLGRVLKVRNWWDEVHEHLVLGARPMRGDADRLYAMGITGVVNMCEEFSGPVAQYRELGIEQLWLPTVDFNHPARHDVEQGARFIEEHAQRSGKVYVHCKAGRARSATIVLWWMVKYHQITPERAQDAILRARPHSNPEIYQRPVIQELWTEIRGGDPQHSPAETP